MNEIGYRTERFIVSDGGSTSRVWMQIVADVLQQPVQRLAGHPGSCVGAAWTAAIGAGLASDWSAISAFVRPADTDRAPARGGRDLSPRLSPLSRALSPPRRTPCVMSVFRAVAWDIDGTLIDSEGLHQRCADRVRRRFRRRPLRSSPRGVPRRSHARRLDRSQAAVPQRRSSGGTWIAAIERFYVARAPSLCAYSRRDRERFARSRRRASLRPACRTQAARSSTPISTRSEFDRRSRSRSASRTSPRASPIPSPFAKRRAASRCRPRRSSRSRTAARARVRRERRGSYVVGYAPNGNAFAGSRSIDRGADGSGGYVRGVIAELQPSTDRQLADGIEEVQPLEVEPDADRLVCCASRAALGDDPHPGGNTAERRTRPSPRRWRRRGARPPASSTVVTMFAPRSS